MEEKDYLGNILREGDEVLYLGTYGRSPHYKRGKIQKIEYDGVWILKNGSSKPGKTFAERCINLKFVIRSVE